MLKRPMCLIGLAVVLVTYFLMCVLKVPALAERAGVKEKQHVCLTGQVTKKEVKNGKNTIYLKEVHFKETSETSELSPGTYSIIAYLENDTQVRIGSTVVLEGTCRLFEKAENDGQFDAARYYEIHGIDFSVTQAQITAVGTKYGKWKELLHECREYLKSIYSRYLPEKEAGILYALLLGDKTSLDAEVKDLYMRAGIVHILSLSGVKMLLLALMKQSLNRTNTAFHDMTCGNKYIIIQYILGTIMRCCRSHSICGVIFKKYILAKGCTFWRKYKQLSKSKITKGVSAYGLQRI